MLNGLDCPRSDLIVALKDTNLVALLPECDIAMVRRSTRVFYVVRYDGTWTGAKGKEGSGRGEGEKFIRRLGRASIEG